MIASVAPEYNSYIDKNELFDFLSSFFLSISAHMTSVSSLFKAIFLFEEDQQNIYMAYIRDD